MGVFSETGQSACTPWRWPGAANGNPSLLLQPVRAREQVRQQTDRQGAAPRGTVRKLPVVVPVPAALRRPSAAAWLLAEGEGDSIQGPGKAQHTVA